MFTSRRIKVLDSLRLSLDLKVMSVDLSNPDGKGVFTITAIGQKEDTMTLSMEGKVEGYGFITLTHEYEYMYRANSKERSLGTVTGAAEAILEDGGLVYGPRQMGAFTRDSDKMEVYFTDHVSNGDHNFVRFEIDLITKQSDVSFWSLK